MKNYLTFTENIALQTIKEMGAEILENLCDSKVTDFVIRLDGKTYEMYATADACFQSSGYPYALIPLS